MQRPEVTIVIPYFHTYTEHLRECLESICQQTFTQWEAFVVDDASETDTARPIVERLGDPRITVLYHRRNRGQAAARNTGIRAGSGAYVVPIDCDDRIAPAHLDKLHRALSLYPEYGLAYSDYQLFDLCHDVLRFPVRDLKTLLREQWLPHPGTMVRRGLWARAGGYCEEEIFRSGNEDWEYFLRLAEVDLRAVRVPEPLYFYRQHPQSITSRQFAVSDYAMREEMYRRHQALFNEHGGARAFLSGGYRTSGRALWRSGHRAAGVKLMLHAGWLAPGDFISRAVRRRPRAA